ncbi:antibiotic biosynthesis monooxygenase [Rhizobium mongolense]|uniref:antibiotic biosynthesis monooxygenase n=1 Tax=Rhizobium mongolense TaxID=57676 RepID=UPI0034A39B6D
MILELTEITVKAVDEAAFEAGVTLAAPLFLQAKGCRGVSLHRVVENPGTYRLLVRRETIDNHMVDFRNSDGYQEWRRLVSPCFNGTPNVTHSEAVAKY